MQILNNIEALIKKPYKKYKASIQKKAHMPLVSQPPWGQY